MGVHGLWRLIEPSGKPVPLETLENKVLAVDVSIWLHQAIKGFQDSRGAPVPNAHLLGIYHRVCKLLYFKVKPIFIFDGGVPVLKKQTIAKRHQQKSRNISEAERLQKQLLNTLLKHTAISKVLSEKTKALALAPKKASKHENMYALPPSELDSTISSSEDDDDLDYITSDTTDSSPTKHWDLHTIDMSSVHFKSLPVDVRHEILTELKETRKQNSWGRLHELPRQSDDFSVYQMRRLLKRQAVQSALEDAEKEMGGHSLSLAELESILKDHGVATTNDVGKRIASDENTRYLLIKDVKQAVEKARREEQLKLESEQKEDTDRLQVQDNTEDRKIEEKTKTKADLEYEEDLEKAIALSLQEEPSTSKTETVSNSSDDRNKLEFSFLENFKDADFQSDSSEEVEEVPATKPFSSAQNYMMEYSGLTPNEIAKILHDKNKQPIKRSKRKKITVKAATVESVEIMSDSDESNEFIEVPFDDQKKDMVHESLNEANHGIEPSKKNKPEMASSDVKFDESTVSEEDMKENTNIINIESRECIIREGTKHENLSTSEESDALKGGTKNNSINKNDITDVPTKSDSSEKIEKNLDVNIMSGSDEYNGLVEVPLNDQKNDMIGVSSEIREKYPKGVEASEKRKESASCDVKFNESAVSEENTKNNTNMMNIESIDEYAISKLNEASKHESNEMSSNHEYDALRDDTKISSMIKNDTTNILEKNSGGEKNEKNSVVEVMSDSDSNSSVEFIEVSDNKHADNFMEIVINPNQSIKDDLFVDIFHEKKESQGKESIPIVIQPHMRPDDDLFSDVFNEKVAVVEKINTFLSKQVSETEKKLEVIKEDEVLIIQNVEKSEESTTSSKSETTAAIKNSSHVNLKRLKTINLDKPLETHEVHKAIKKIERQNLNEEQMQKLKNDLQNEKIDLMIEKSTRDRMASNITDQMNQEAQDLLELFGVPYIVAPMEAEAQCAFLDEIELTDGTITDDSDIWLFGGRTVYKNFFNQSKYVMEFRAENIKHNFKLTREQMILFALLVGSDYTTGLQGVGPVTALEILAAFPPSTSKEISLSHTQLLSGLREFRSWFNKGKTAGPGRSALKNKLKNIFFTDSFPSVQVVQAYLEPIVETSREKFSWAKPNFIGLKEFAREKFGWSATKAEEILKPVIKRVEETQVQKSIKDFFKTVHKVQSHEAENKMSKRVKTAIDRIGKTPDELIAEEMEALSKAKPKKPRKKKNDNENKQKAEDKDIQSKPTRKRANQKKNEDTVKSSAETIANSEENTEDILTKQVRAPKPKRSRKKNDKAIENTSISDKISIIQKDSEKGQTIENSNEDTNSKHNKNDQKAEDKSIQSKSTRKRTKQKNQSTSENSKVAIASSEENTRDVLIKQLTAPKSKRPRKTNNQVIENTSTTENCEKSQTVENVDEDADSLEKYENIAIELKKRRQRKNDLSNREDIHKKKQTRPPPKKIPPTESIPKVFEEDEEIQLLKATTSRSLKRVEEIDQEIKNELSQDVKKKRLPDFHQREVIHQKLRDKSDLLRNKLKAIEVFRKSKKGPGYVKKQRRNIKLPKEDAALSESSSDE